MVQASKEKPPVQIFCLGWCSAIRTLLKLAFAVFSEFVHSFCRTGTSAFTGSLLERSQRLTEQLKRNPRFLEAMVEQLKGDLGDELEKRGIRKVKKLHTSIIVVC